MATQTLKQKVNRTALFSADEKVTILTGIDTYPEMDVAALERIIDEYDAKHLAVLSTFRQNMNAELDEMERTAKPEDQEQVRQAVGQIKQGLSAVTTYPTGETE